MARKCKCGGNVKNIDPVFPAYSKEHHRVLYTQERLFAGKATSRCDKCGKVFTQTLRQAKTKKTHHAP